MIWLLIGAALGCLRVLVSLLRRPMPIEHQVQGFSLAAFLGAMVTGLVFGYWRVVSFNWRKIAEPLVAPRPRAFWVSRVDRIFACRRDFFKPAC